MGQGFGTIFKHRDSSMGLGQRPEGVLEAVGWGFVLATSLRLLARGGFNPAEKPPQFSLLL